MKKDGKIYVVIVFLLILIALAGWGVVMFQANRQKEISQGVKGQLMEYEYRRKAEDAIKRQVEYKKQEQQLLILQEYQRQLENFIVQQMDQYKQGVDISVSQMQTLLRQQADDNKKALESFSKIIDDVRQKQEAYHQEQDTVTKKIHEDFIRLETLSRSQSEKANNRLRALESQFVSYKRTLENYKQKFDDFRQQILSQEPENGENKNIPAK